MLPESAQLMATDDQPAAVLDLDAAAAVHLLVALVRSLRVVLGSDQALAESLQRERVEGQEGSGGVIDRSALVQLAEIIEGHRVQPLLVDYDAAGRMLSVSESTVKRMVKSGELPAVHLRDSVARIPVAAIHRLVEEAE